MQIYFILVKSFVVVVDIWWFSKSHVMIWVGQCDGI